MNPCVHGLFRWSMTVRRRKTSYRMFFLALWERRAEVDFDRPLQPLLSVAVKNRAIDLLRSRKWRGGEPGEDGLDTCIRTLVADHIEEEFQLSQLSDEDRFLHFRPFRAMPPGLPAEPHDGAEKPGDRRTAQHQCQDRREAYRLGIGKTPITARPQRLPATFPLKNGKKGCILRDAALFFVRLLRLAERKFVRMRDVSVGADDPDRNSDGRYVTLHVALVVVDHDGETGVVVRRVETVPVRVA